ncbi:MAG TPA: ATP-dependent sacrificial sulfur transferase LarE [Candidatus Copromorpha excrementigallinarum]|uniref:ATP-dependent sacrificial sulfur transferase LarE n=1 Tax=Candidatus Allocopromorpha excrementigallinarum TaxID=2840742 RepID=A0A9D1I394_9FIRM|nr:ATP-dependent sacrificial sulfur transferase LarE [Candidatus Copromorpha excrementigallinarum]
MMKKELEEKLKKLKTIISGYGQMLVALSGGVDSAFLLIFAWNMWRDDRVAALTASGPNFAPDETRYAAELCDRLGISHKTVNVDFLMSIIEDNPPDRCYSCKKAIFSLLKERADMVGSVLADGTNLDDMSDYRPGYRAVEELGVSSPLKDAGLTKAEIREAMKAMAEEDSVIKGALAFALWNKPAFACLASRIPYGERITVEKLKAVYKAESLLMEEGFSQVRVRHHGDVARIEVLPEDRSRFFDVEFMDRINEGIKKCGFKFAALDLGGYRMGNMNEEKK